MNKLAGTSFCVALLLMLGGCQPAKPVPNAQAVAEEAPPGGYTPAVERDSLLAALALNERRWRSARLRTYEAELRIDCFCPPQPATPLVLRVNADSLVALRDKAGHQLFALTLYSRYGVDSLFRMAETAIRDSGQKVMVRYDSKLGYPREIHTDTRWAITDMWLRIRLDHVRPVALPGTRVAPPT
jgi:Family of unknown function (DUF6174)